MAYFDSAGDVAYTKKSMPYYQAKGAAWGYYNEGTDDYIYNLDEPYSVNDIIRRAINPNSKIVKDFPVLREKSPFMRYTTPAVKAPPCAMTVAQAAPEVPKL